MTQEEYRRLIEQSTASQFAFRDRWEAMENDPAMSIDPERSGRILSDVAKRLNDNYPFFHPRYAGQMIKPPHPIAIAAYLLAMQINPNNHALDGGPATAAMELEAVASIAGMFGMQEHLGHLTSSGTIANLEALWVARSLHPKKKIAFSPNAHYTHSRMCNVINTESRTVDTGSLEHLETEFKKGDIGTLVVTIGTTGTGAVEPLDAILPLAKKYGVRIHADCAYGGFFTILARAEQPVIAPGPFLSLHQCDSIVIDPHKHGLQPYGCGCVIFADPSVGTLYKHDSPYTYFTSSSLHLGEISLECSRAGASAAALWATLQYLPLLPEKGFGPILTRTRHAAVSFSGLLKQHPQLKMFCDPDLDIVTYFPQPKQFSASGVSAASRTIFEEGMKRTDAPLFVATLNVESELIQRNNPTFIADAPSTVILRSVLMKPEHDSFVPQFIDELAALSNTVV